MIYQRNLKKPLALGAVFVLTVLIVMGCGIGNAELNRGRIGTKRALEQEIEIDGKTRYFIAIRPRSYNPGNPAVVLLHGGSQSMRKVLYPNTTTRRWLELAKREGFLLLVPNGFNPHRNDAYGDRQTWNDLRPGKDRRRSQEDDVAFVMATLDWASKEHGIDRSRVYVTGASNGGMMAFRLLVEQSQHFAAAAAFIASLPQDKIPEPSEGTPIMMMNGTDDLFVPWQGGIVAGGAEPVRSIEATINYWIRVNSADPTKGTTRTIPPIDPIYGCPITETSYSVNNDELPVVLLYRVEGGGHNIPAVKPPKYSPRIQRQIGKQCQGINGIDLAWEFMKNFSSGNNKAKNGQKSEDSSLEPEPGSPKTLDNSPATRRDVVGRGQLFEAIHVPGFTDFREGLNGFALADVDKNGFLDILTITTPPFALETIPMGDVTGSVRRTRNPLDKLRLLLNYGNFHLKQQEVVLSGSSATPDDLGQGWRGSQIPALADFNADGLYDIYVTRQAPMTAGEIREGFTPIGSSLFVSDGSFARFRDVSVAMGSRNELAYNRQVSLGDVNRDGFIDIALGADNLANAFEGLPKSALFVFKPKNGKFEGGKFEDIGGTNTIPDFGGFYHDSTRDKAGPNIVLRDVDNDGDLDLLQSYHINLWPAAPALMPYSPAEYRQGVFTWRNLLVETGLFRFEKLTNNGLAVEESLRYDRKTKRLKPMGDASAPGLPYLIFGDVNNDGNFDALAVGWSDPHLSPAPLDVGGRFWYNLGKFRFQEATQKAGLSTLNNRYREWYSFFGANLPPELVNYRPPNRPFRSQPGLVRANPLDLRPLYSDAAFADFNNDGWLDLVVLDRREWQNKDSFEGHIIEARTVLFMNQGNGIFEPKPMTFSGLNGSGISVEAVDLNNDGLIDLIIAADPDNSGIAADPRRYESMIFLNTGLDEGRQNHWLRLRFSGIRDAELLGARVELREPNNKQLIGMRGIYTNQTYKSSSPLEAHFGLGAVSNVDIAILLPDGRHVSLSNVAGNRYIDVNLSNKILTDLPIVEQPKQP